MMQSGDLSHRIELQAQTRVPDGGGGFVTTWVAIPGFTNLAASKWPISGKEQFEGGRTVAVASHRIRIRFRRDVKSSWRIKDLFTGKYFSIVTAPIDLGDQHQWIEFFVKEVTT